MLARLVTQKLVPSQSLAATFLGTEAERQAKVLEAIQQVAAKDWERFFTSLQTSASQNGVHEEK